jgi:SAM-dependent methyltransferase|tara:strand:- start:4220 stop:5056 length:837 start_codon:yes stop_codon:yes gene_type:complete
MKDTFLRSCEHWSEASRNEMENFYTLASVDYKYLAEAFDWKKWIETHQANIGQRSLKILDVACGSGKFPLALVEYAKIADAKISPIEYALLDPSAFSIAEARKVLQPPFQASYEFETTLQAFSCEREAFDIIWATHALYAVPKDELKEALEHFIFGIAKSGFIAHASHESHYLNFYQLYLNGFKNRSGEPYSSAEQIIQTLEDMGVSHKVKKITYENSVSENQLSQVEGYLQRCIFDDTISLDEMRNNSMTGPYLDGCIKNGQWCFKQQVMLIFLLKC